MARGFAALFVVALLVPFAATPAGADPPSGGAVVAQCQAAAGALPKLPDPPLLNVPVIGPLAPTQPVSAAPTRTCRAAEAFAWSAAADCRLLVRSFGAPAGDPCTPIDGRSISAAQITAYQSSWTHRALVLQQAMGGSAPLWEEQILHTHNSFNSSAYTIPTNGSPPSYYPTLTNQDPNQVYSLTDQLNMDVRFLELDLHWVPSPFGTLSTGGNWVTLCHGDSANPAKIHVGCTIDRPLQDGLAEIRRWMDAHPAEFVFIYFEDQLNNNRQAHDVAGQLIDQAFDGAAAPNVVKPAAPCQDMPLAASQTSMETGPTHPHLLIVGNCSNANNGGPGSAWERLVHSRGPGWDEHGDASTYDPNTNPATSPPDGCAADRKAHGPGTFRRWFGDSTFLTGMTSHDQDITVATAAAMQRCGVNIIGMDQLRPDDGRLQALVWSWAPNEPAGTGACALHEGSTGHDPGRITTADCNALHPAACLDSTGSWRVTTVSLPWQLGPGSCAAEFPGSTFAMPVNGLRNQLLVEAKHGQDVWINYKKVGVTWTPGAAPPVHVAAARSSQQVGSPGSGQGTGSTGRRTGRTGRAMVRPAMLLAANGATPPVGLLVVLAVLVAAVAVRRVRRA